MMHLYSFITLFAAAGCNFSSFSEAESKSHLVPITYLNNGATLFSLQDAEKILGEPAQLGDSATNIKNGIVIYSCSYIAKANDMETGKNGAIYFMLEEYVQIDSVKKTYSSIKTSNEHSGIKTLNDLGDEAYFHSDNENFYFILVRKGTKMVRMKVNKITTNTSLEEFNAIAVKITDKM